MYTAEQVRMQLVGRVGRYPSQSAAAKALGVSRQLLNMVLRGHRAPTVPMLDALHLGPPELRYPHRRRSSKVEGSAGAPASASDSPSG